MGITHEQVRELFDYRFDGHLIWKVNKTSKARKGDAAGTSYKNQYNQVQINGVLYLTHRVIWLWHHGYTPEHSLDHINRVKHDNRIENLREASRQCNARNTGNPKNNTSGVKGVFWDKSKMSLADHLMSLYISDLIQTIESRITN